MQIFDKSVFHGGSLDLGTHVLRRLAAHRLLLQLLSAGAHRRKAPGLATLQKLSNNTQIDISGRVHAISDRQTPALSTAELPRRGEVRRKQLSAKQEQSPEEISDKLVFCFPFGCLRAAGPLRQVLQKL